MDQHEQHTRALDELGAAIDKRLAEIDALRSLYANAVARNERLIAAMKFVINELDEDADINANGGPNKAMWLASELKDALYGPGGY